jgi:hypothetical protein
MSVLLRRSKWPQQLDEKVASGCSSGWAKNGQEQVGAAGWWSVAGCWSAHDDAAAHGSSLLVKN